MAWERRRNGSYYYRKVRRGDRVLSEYAGSGPLAELLAEDDNVFRQDRQIKAEELRQLVEAETAIDRQIDEMSAAVGDLVTAVLLANGYHQHRRQWRRVRGHQREYDG